MPSWGEQPLRGQDRYVHLTSQCHHGENGLWEGKTGTGCKLLTDVYLTCQRCFGEKSRVGNEKCGMRTAYLCMPINLPVRTITGVPAGSPSRGGDIAVYVFDINQPSLPIPFYSVLVYFSVFIAISTVFHFIESPENPPLSHSVLPVLFLPYWSFQLYISS